MHLISVVWHSGNPHLIKNIICEEVHGARGVVVPKLRLIPQPLVESKTGVRSVHLVLALGFGFLRAGLLSPPFPRLSLAHARTHASTRALTLALLRS